MKRLSAYLALPLAAVLAVGCKAGPKGFMPLETGHKVVYEVEYAGLLGAVQRAEAVQRVEEKTRIGGHEYFRIVTAIKGIPGHVTDTYYQRFAADGLHEVRYVDGRPVDYLSIPWPLKVGKAWLYNDGLTEMTCRVEERASAVLPERTYEDAWKISCYSVGSGFKEQTYLVEGVGEVRILQDFGSLKIEMRLREAG
ncbi:MAG TPA: hypothetical protein VF789_19630 [Thermoanaerobaculia bacterium]